MTTGVQILADAIEAEECGTVFALMGDANMHLLAEIDKRGTTSVIHGRHENAVLAMADGWARCTGGVGVCSITCGPGITQIPTSLTAAVRHRTPLVVFAGDTPTDAAYHFQEFDAAPLVRSTGAKYERVTEVDRLADAVQSAFFLARTLRTPVVLSVPMNVLPRSPLWYDGYAASAPRLPQAQRLHPDPDALAQADTMLRAARRPIIIAGRGAIASGAGPALVALGDRIGALLGTTIRAKGLFRGQPHDVGVVGAFASRSTRASLATADCIVGVGAGLGYYTSQAGYLAPDARVLQIDVDPVGYREGQFIADVYLRCDARVGVESLVGMLDQSNHRNGGYRTSGESLPADVTSERPVTLRANDGCFNPDDVMAALDHALTDDSRVVIGGGHFWTFAVTALHKPDVGNFVLTHDFGVIGQALPVAIGVKCATPSAPVVVVEGDGSLLMNVQELETAARHGVGVTICVVNDGAYGAEFHKLNAQGLSGKIAFFGRPDFAKVAAAFGMRSVRLTDLGMLPDLLREQRERNDPLLIDIPVTERVVSRPYRRLHFGEDV